MLVTGVSAGLAYRGVRGAFEREFTRRLEQLCELAASQLNAEDVRDVQRLGVESNGYLSLQAQLDAFRATTGLANVALIDSAGVTMYDVRDPETLVGLPSAFDSLARAEVAAARAGRVIVSDAYRTGDLELRAAFAPVLEGRRPIAVLVAEAPTGYGAVLSALGRTLTLIALVSLVAIAVLAAILVRVTGSTLSLERRLSRSENLAAMGRLTATLAHEIKNPLAIIRGSAKRLSKLEPEAQGMADSVVEEVDRLGRTVSRYLQFARGEAAGGDVGDASATLAATLDLLEGEFRERRVLLLRGGTWGAAPVPLDAESLKQVWLNLVLNALEAVAEGGRVQAAVTADRGHVEVRIDDDGPGIPADVIARLGDPFLTTKAQGSGLGLFLSRRFVRGAGGALIVENRPGGGASVRVRLPLARAGGAAPGATA